MIIRRFFFLCFLLCSISVVAQQAFEVKAIQVTGNKKTRETIILREVAFQKELIYSEKGLQKALEETKENLNNTRLFNFVNFQIDTLPNNFLNVNIIVVERWYFFPAPIFKMIDPNFNTWWQTKDFKRINYGGNVTHYNFRGRREKVRAIAKVGFNDELGLSYYFPYINKKQTLGLDISGKYQQTYEVTHNTLNNKRELYNEIGGVVLERKEAKIEFNHRPKNYFQTYAGLNYYHEKVKDTVLALQPQFFNLNQNTWEYFELHFGLRYDKRDSRNYATSGQYISLNVYKPGLGVVQARTDVSIFQADVRYYYRFTKRLSSGAQVKWTKLNHKGKYPYRWQRSLGYGNEIRGYELYIVDGEQYAVGKANLNYNLIPTKKVNFAFIKDKRFSEIFFALHVNLFADVGMVKSKYEAQRNSLSNEMLHSFGVGLSLVTYYDKVVRVDYSINKMGERGFFLHFEASF